MGNKKVLICIVMFFIIFIFGIIGPDLSKRDKYIQDEYVTTTGNMSVSTTEIATVSDTSEELSTSQQATEEYITTEESVTTEELTTPQLTTEEQLSDVSSKYILSQDVENKIDHMVDAMTLEEKVGQIFFIKNDGRFDGSILEDYPVGGVILFKGDFQGKTADMVKNSIADLQNNSKTPLFIGIDEEGGSVVRLSCYSHLASGQFRSPRDLYYSGGFGELKKDTISKSELLLSYGINVNFAPVCDIPDSSGDFIYNRSFSEDVGLTEEYVELMVGTMSECNIGSVLKHFPGYGNNADTHNGIVKDVRPRTEFDTVDLIPFETGIESGAWCILVSHNIVECMDKDNPASLSPEIHRILREDMGFEGVIITDDLMMGGVSSLYSDKEAAVKAVLAGNDMVLSTNYQVQYEAVLAAVKSGEITEDRIEKSVKRVLRWKYTLGLLDI